MKLRVVRTIIAKELVDIARDRRALLAAVFLPILIVPLLMGGMGKLMEFGQRKLLEEPSRIAIIGGAHAPKVDRVLRSFETISGLALLPEEFVLGSLDLSQRAASEGRGARAGGKDGESAGGAEAAKKPGALTAVLGGDVDLAKVSILKAVDPPPADRTAAEAAVTARTIDAVVVIPEGFDAALEDEKVARLAIVYDSAYDKSKLAWRRITSLLSAFERGVTLRRLAAHGVSAEALNPIHVEEATVASKAQEGRAALALMLPYMLILMCFSGAIYPAIDLGAGEKERGTLETLLVSPAGRAEIVLGKLAVIFFTSLLGASLNVASIAFSLTSGVFGGLTKHIQLSVDPGAALVALLLMVPVAAVFASVLLAVSIFAKSFKEAQVYFAPFNVAIILPAFVSAIPGVELTRGTALIPIVNVSLAIKEVLSGTYKADCLALIVVSTAALAALSTVFCARWFQREEVLFRS